MPTDHLNLLASWASIISLVVSTISLFYLRSIKANIIKFRRTLRLRELVADIRKAQPLQGEMPPELISKLESLKWNLPIRWWSKLTQKGRLIIAMHKQIENRDLIALREILMDLSSFSEEL